MKKILISICATVISLAASAQGPYDALLLSRTPYLGTARTVSMGNAFTALGGDMGAISINPAGSAVYRNSELSATLGYFGSGVSSTCNTGTLSDSFGSLKFSNFGVLLAFGTGSEKGMQNYNFAFSLNRVADFNAITGGSWRSNTATRLGAYATILNGTQVSELDLNISTPYVSTSLPWGPILSYQTYLTSPEEGYTDSYVASTENYDENGKIVTGGMLDQYHSKKTVGGIMEYALNAGVNLFDFIYLGANINLYSVDYDIDEYYSEKAIRSTDFQDGIQSWSEEYVQSTEGAGINLKLGAIVTPLPGLRIGATFTTPTAYNLTDTWRYYSRSSFDNGNSYSDRTPEGIYSYRLKTPLRWSIGAAYTFENLALVSVEYEGIDYSKNRFSDDRGRTFDFERENNMISGGFTASGFFRAGIEVKPLKGISIRAGYNRISSPGSLVEETGAPVYTYPAINLVSCGGGFRFGTDGCCSLDLAYQRVLKNGETYQVYGNYPGAYGDIQAPVIDALNFNDRIIATFAWRF